MKKKCEFMVKQCVFGPTISAIPPKKYAERFTTFISKMIVVPQHEQNEEVPPKGPNGT